MKLPSRRWWIWNGAFVVGAVVLSAYTAQSAAESVLAVPTTPIGAELHPSSLLLTAADVGFAKETCKRRGLSWSRFELSEDGTHVSVYCESEDIVRAQTAARWREIRADKREQRQAVLNSAAPAQDPGVTP